MEAASARSGSSTTPETDGAGVTGATGDGAIEATTGAAGAAGLADVGRSVEQLDAMTQQNAALVEQTAAAANSLKDNAKRLGQEMAFFRLVTD